MPIEQGRLLLLEGRVRRRLRQKLPARGAFAAAERLFADAGAKGLAAQARAEAARVGVRAPTATDLTVTERQVATAAARGLTNRQIAEIVFLSSKSVDGVLARVYGKLGIHSRAELGARLAGESMRAPDRADEDS
jgi:DNA-binding NarL/FixJ family response regulator